MKDTPKATLIITTVCIIFVCLSNLMDYFETGDPGGIVSNLCFLASLVFIVIAWIQYISKRKES